MKNEKQFNVLVEMLNYKDDMYILIEDIDLSPRSYNYLKKNNIVDVASILEYLVTNNNGFLKKIRKEIIDKIYGYKTKEVITYLDKIEAINKIEYHEKQIKILKMKYGI